MLISPKEINQILKVAGTQVTARGKKYFEQGRVKLREFEYTSENEFEANVYVRGTYRYEVVVKKRKDELQYGCNCPAANGQITPCKHVIATIFDMYINPEKYVSNLDDSISKTIDDSISIENNLDKLIEKRNDRHWPLIEYYENLELDTKDTTEDKVNIIPTLELMGFNDTELCVKFKFGKKRYYILKDIINFVENIYEKNNVRYGKELEFVHDIDNFSDESKELVKLIYNYGLNYFQIRSVSNLYSIESAYKNCIPLKYSYLDKFFEIMKDKNIQLEYYTRKNGWFEHVNKLIQFVENDPLLSFKVYETDNNKITIELLSNFRLFNGVNDIYILTDEKLYKCSKEYKEKMLPLLKEFRSKDFLDIKKEYASSVCEYLLPNISSKSSVVVKDEILEKYRPQKLGTKVFLDIDENSDIIAEVKFCYGDVEFNPFDEDKKINCNRNFIEERKAKSLFKKYNFLVNVQKKCIYLSNEDDIYNFLTDGINIFMQKFEVLVTDKLKNKQIINTKNITMGVRIKNDLLEINFEDLGVDEEELREIFKRYKAKKKYYRLKDGTYMNLDSSGIDTLNKISNNFGVSEKEIASGNVNLPKYRAIYLDSLLKDDNSISVQKDVNFKNIVKDIKDTDDLNFEIPKNLNANLRPYQKTGYNWLKVLDKYNFGGILADDMGLGKTIQVISIFEDEKLKNKKDKTTSIVICPSSLCINWEKELSKFAPDLKVLVISGNAKYRENVIKDIGKYDVVITSYDLLKRDIDFYQDFKFKYAIADEAQYIKNNNTKNAKALKKLKASTRFALTGTPIENSLSELWSIFDYIMPGYLFSYKKFKEDYETPIVKDENALTLERLQKIVAPFVLRRVKKDVLKELPDKTETIMYSKMEEEQQKVYNSYLLHAKEEMLQEFDKNGFEKSRMKVLSMITRLRQICCHPSLFIENYTGESSKLTQCMQIIEDAISSGHKILLFSGFTSMFDIITKELEKRNIEYFILTGKTKVDTRIEMVDDFNVSKSTKVFLISLKAGGTGLNLTGADMVIHYDPWWNLSAQNQATDRAYRIGQKNNVQVFKLISEGTIEEKIVNLQNKKRDLTNSVITEKETFINKMSKEEILDLFDMN